MNLLLKYCLVRVVYEPILQFFRLYSSDYSIHFIPLSLIETFPFPTRNNIYTLNIVRIDARISCIFFMLKTWFRFVATMRCRVYLLSTTTTTPTKIMIRLVFNVLSAIDINRKFNIGRGWIVREFTSAWKEECGRRQNNGIITPYLVIKYDLIWPMQTEPPCQIKTFIWFNQLEWFKGLCSNGITYW